MSEFESDNRWQNNVRLTLLVPYFYERYFDGNFESIEPGSARSAGGVDCIANGKRFDEKIVRWPVDEDGQPRAEGYDAFALETQSCTVAGRERPGWMRTNRVDYLLYCFMSRTGDELRCYQVDFPALQVWFWPRIGSWAEWISTQINRTACRIVPISEVMSAVWTKEFVVRGPENPFWGRCRCGLPGLYVGAVGWMCEEHRQ